MKRTIVLLSAAMAVFIPVFVSAQTESSVPDTIRIDVPSDLVITGNRILISNLRGLAMQTAQGEAVGTIEDAVVTTDGAVESIVANVEQFEEQMIESGRYMIPAESFVIREDTAVLDVAQALRSAQKLESELEQSIGPDSFLVSKLIGRPVQDRDGRTIGSIENLVADLTNGSITYAAISLSGVLGAEADTILAFPFDRLTFEQGDAAGRVQQ